MVRPNWIFNLLLPVGFGLASSCVAVVQSQSPADLSGLDASEVSSIEDNLTLLPTDQMLVRLLFRVSKTSEKNIVRFAKSSGNVSMQQVMAETRKYRAHPLHLKGRAKRVWAVRIPGMDSESPISEFYLVKFEDDQGSEFLVATPRPNSMLGGNKQSNTGIGVPAAWPLKTVFDQPADCYGLFLAVFDFLATPPEGQSDPDQAENDIQPLGQGMDLRQSLLPLFVARRIHWYPDRPDESMQVTGDHVLLAELGVDIGQFDLVRANNNRRLSTEESSCFFQLLAAANSLTAEEMPNEAVGFQQMLENPHACFGRSVRLKGHVRRAIKIEITDPFQRQQSGLDHYYELDMFVPLRASKVVVNTTKPDGTSDSGSDAAATPQMVYEDRFPVTVCVAELPCSEQEMENQNFIVEGFFFKLWNYQSNFTESHAGQAGQVSPLIIGLMPTIEKSSTSVIDTILAAGLLLVVLVGTLIAWFLFRSDRRSGEYLKRYHELPESIDIKSDGHSRG